MKKSEINLLLGFFGVLIAFCAYQFVYKKMEVKTAELENKSAQLVTEIAVLESWLPDEEFYVSETERMHDEITSIVNEFPSNVLPEDDMKLAYQMDNRVSQEKYVFIKNMSFTDPGMAYTTTYDTSGADVSTVNPITIDPIYPVYTLYQAPVSLGIECSYSGIKEMIQNIYDKTERKSIDSITLTYDNTTGRLTGSLAMTSYYLFGTDKIYKEPDLYKINKGTDNIFGTMEFSEDEAAE